MMDSVVDVESAPGERHRSRALVRRLTILLAIALALSGFVAVRGRWATAYDFPSSSLTSLKGTGTRSGGGEGPFTLGGREARLRWQLNPGVDRIRVAVIPADRGARFDDWERGQIPAGAVGGTEFTTTDRVGYWSLSQLAAGPYWVRYEWWTRGTQTGQWSYQVEERVPWWRRSRS